VPSIGRAKATQSPFAAWLERAMLARGLPGPSTAGEAIGIPQSQISRYLNDRVKPSRASVAKLARWAGVDEQEIWALIPETGPLGPTVAASGAPEDQSARIDRLVRSIELLLASPGRLELAHAGARSPDLDLAEDTALLAAEGYKGLVRVEVKTEDLVAHRQPVPPGALLWLDPRATAEVGEIVGVMVAGERHLRILGPDGHSLLSSVPGRAPLDLRAVDRVVGVGRLMQATV